jgi:Tfp pilus assembly protein PilF
MKAAWILAFAVLAGSGCAVRSSRAVPSPVERAMRTQVRNAVRAGEGDAMVRQLRHRIIADPGNIQLRLDLAQRYAASGIQELATEHYRLAAERFPDHAAAHLLLARALRKEELTVDAAQVMDNYLARNPYSAAEMWSWAGIFHDELGQYGAGERAHRNALLRRRPTAWLLNNLGQNLLLQGRADEAAREFRSALALEPRNQLARNNLGVALSRNAHEAVLHLQSVTDPSTAHNNLAVVLMEQGRLAEARQELDRALAYRRDNAAALKNLAILGEMDGLGAVLKAPAGKRNRGAQAAGVRTMSGGKQ